jgi:streptogramin lyase
VLQELLDECRARAQIVILDCCYSGAFSRPGAFKGDQRVGAVDALSGRGRAILTASDHLQYALQGDEVTGSAGTSVFTEAVVEGLRTGAADRDGDGRITVDDAYFFAHDRMSAERRGQHPTRTVVGGEGDIVLAWTAPRELAPGPSAPHVERSSELLLARGEHSSELLLARGDHGEPAVPAAVRVAPPPPPPDVAGRGRVPALIALAVAVTAAVVAGLVFAVRSGSTTAAGGSTTTTATGGSTTTTATGGSTTTTAAAGSGLYPDLPMLALSVAGFGTPADVVVLADKSMVIVEFGSCRLLRVTVAPSTEVVAGNGQKSGGGDGTDPLAVGIQPIAAVVDDAGRVVFSDETNNVVRMWDPKRRSVTTVAGRVGEAGTADGALADARFDAPRGIVRKPDGTLFVVDSRSRSIRRIGSDGRVTTVFRQSGSTVKSLDGIAIAPSGDLVVADPNGNRVFSVDSSGRAVPIVGTGAVGSTGDNGPATAATLHGPARVTYDSAGRLLISELEGNRVRRVSRGGIITTIAGNGTDGSTGDGGPATAASLSGPVGLYSVGDILLITETRSHLLRIVRGDGSIGTIVSRAP